MNYGKAIILMATYNGKKYIEAQLDSIINQTYKNWELYISDDLSTDGTMDILKGYSKKEPRIKKIILNNSNQHGPYANFYNLINYLKKNINTSDISFYFYCDQDDIWINKKVQEEIECLTKQNKINPGKPNLCYSDLMLMDSKGKLMNKKLSDNTNIDLSSNPYNIFFSNRYVWGTTMAHNNVLWDMINLDGIDGTISHDNYITYYAVAFGSIKYINECLVNYRRHDNNSSGIPHGYKISSAIRKIKSFSQIIRNHAASYCEDLVFIKNTNNENEILSELNSALLNGGIKALKFIKKYNIKTSNDFFSNMSIKIILFFKLYQHTDIFKNIINN